MGFVLGVLNPHVVEIGSVVIHWYGVIIAAGILAALQLSTKEAKKKGLEEDTIIDMALWAIPIGLLKQLLRQGEVALSYVLWYSVGRFFIEGMRTDSLWIGEWIRVSQALSLALFIGAIVVWFIRRQDYPPISYYSDGNKGQKKTIKMVN